MFNKIILCLCFVFLLFGCSEQESAPLNPTQEVYSNLESAPQPEIAEPMKAIEEIFETVEILGVFDADEQYTEEVLNLVKGEDYEESYIRASEGSYGLADVYIIKPMAGMEDTIKAKFEQIKELRINEFENYDILDAHEIAQNAQIYSYGEYVIMLMLEDMETAADVIKKYIPN